MSGKWHVSIDANKVFQTVRNINLECRAIFKKDVKKDIIDPSMKRTNHGLHTIL